MPVYELRALAWPDVEALPRERTVAILPAGAIEAHGPHLPLGTDLVIADAMARAGAERLSERDVHVVLLPALSYAPAPFAAAFAGTIDLPASVTTSSVVAIVRSLAAHGVRVTAIANAHHDPAHVRALLEAVDEVERDGGATLVFPDLTKRRWAARLTDEFRSGACHAGRYEGSMVLAERPGEVKQETMRRLEPNERSLVEAIRSGIGSFAEAGGRSAYFGVPAEATAEEGRDTIATLGAILHEAVMERMQL
jgi:creatinine amidohydrolase